MKKLLSLMFCMALCMICFTGCGDSAPDSDGSAAAAKQVWDCSMPCALEGDNAMTISQEEIQTSTGALVIENPNDFEIYVETVQWETMDGAEEPDDVGMSATIKSGETYVWENVNPKIKYKLGCSAPVKEGEMISLLVKEL